MEPDSYQKIKCTNELSLEDPLGHSFKNAS